MASLVNEVFSNPMVRDQVRADPGKISVAVEETLRLRPPFFSFFRRTTRPVFVGGTAIPSGTDVYVGWAAANRDVKAYADPKQFRLDRGSNRHLSFGFGIHTCPGAAMARMELRVLLQELFRRVPDMRVAVDKPTYHFGGGDYCYMESLPVTFTPGRPESAVCQARSA